MPLDVDSLPPHSRLTCPQGGEACIFAIKKADVGRYEDASTVVFERLSARRDELNLTSQLCRVNSNFQRHALRAKAMSSQSTIGEYDQYRRSALSGGLMTLLLARRLCSRQVDVYGFEVTTQQGCCLNQSLAYKYYEPGQRDRCCGKSRETLDEQAVIQGLVERRDKVGSGVEITFV